MYLLIILNLLTQPAPQVNEPKPINTNEIDNSTEQEENNENHDMNLHIKTDNKNFEKSVLPLGLSGKLMPLGKSGFAMGATVSTYASGKSNYEIGFTNLLLPGLALTSVATYNYASNNIITLMLLYGGLMALIPEPYIKLPINQNNITKEYSSIVIHLGYNGGAYFVKSKFDDDIDYHLKIGIGAFYIFSLVSGFVSGSTTLHLGNSWDLFGELRFDYGLPIADDDKKKNDFLLMPSGGIGIRYKGESVFVDFVGSVGYLIYQSDLSGGDPSDHHTTGYYPYMNLIFGWDR